MKDFHLRVDTLAVTYAGQDTDRAVDRSSLRDQASWSGIVHPPVQGQPTNNVTPTRRSFVRGPVLWRTVKRYSVKGWARRVPRHVELWDVFRVRLRKERHTRHLIVCVFSVALRPQRPYGLLGTVCLQRKYQDGRFDFHTAPEFSVSLSLCA